MVCIVWFLSRGGKNGFTIFDSFDHDNRLAIDVPPIAFLRTKQTFFFQLKKFEEDRVVFAASGMFSFSSVSTFLKSVYRFLH